MGDDTTDNASKDEDVENDEEEQDDEQSTSDDSSKDDAKDDSGKDQSTESKDDDASKDEKKPDDKKPQDDGAEPPVQKTAKDYIIERKNRKIEKLEKSKKDESGDDDQDMGEDDGDDQNDQSSVHKVVAEAVAPITEELHKERRGREIDQFFTDPANADFKQDEAKIRRWANHPNRAALPVSSVAYEVAGPRLLKIGAQAEREAQAKANKNAPAGHAGKDTKAEKPVSAMTTAEVEARAIEIKKKLADR